VDPQISISGWVKVIELRLYSAQFALRLRNANPRLQTCNAHDAKNGAIAAQFGITHRERGVNIRFGQETKAGRKYTDYRIVRAIQFEVLAENLRSCSKAILPQTIADDDVLRSLRLILRSRKIASRTIGTSSVAKKPAETCMPSMCCGVPEPVRS